MLCARASLHMFCVWCACGSWGWFGVARVHPRVLIRTRTSAVHVPCRSASTTAALAAEEKAFQATHSDAFGLDQEEWDLYQKGLGDGDMTVLARLLPRAKKLIKLWLVRPPSSPVPCRTRTRMQTGTRDRWHWHCARFLWVWLGCYSLFRFPPLFIHRGNPLYMSMAGVTAPLPRH